MRLRLEAALFTVGMLLCLRAAWDPTAEKMFEKRPDLVIAAQAHAPDWLRGERAPLRVVGEIRIPRLNALTMVVEGDDAQSLTFAAGHVPGTAPLGTTGNAAVAGHRETSFRSLRSIRKGDAIYLTAGQRTLEYTVTSTEVVFPDQVEVLSPSAVPVLTLVTCYPFRYVGSAPKRFIVRAVLRENAGRQPISFHS